MHPLLESGRIRTGPYRSNPGEFDGAYQISLPGEARRICIVASTSLGWDHVSVSFGNVSPKTPSWDLMCAVKNMFWEPEIAVMQLHPPQSDYVNFHPGCLHLWRPTHPHPPIPLPPWILVGHKRDSTPEEHFRELQKLIKQFHPASPSLNLHQPSVSLLTKLGTIIVHLEEMLNHTGHPYDLVTLTSLYADPEIQEWRKAMEKQSLLPLKR